MDHKGKGACSKAGLAGNMAQRDTALALDRAASVGVCTVAGSARWVAPGLGQAVADKAGI